MRRSPLDTCREYADGGIDRETTIEELVRYPYVPSPQTDGYDSLIVDPPGTWDELSTALRRGLIDESIYDEVFSRQQRKMEP